MLEYAKSRPEIKWVFKPLLSIILATALARLMFKGYLVAVLNGTSPLLKRVIIFEIAITSFAYLLLCAAIGTVLTSVIKHLIKKLKNRTRV